MAAFKNPYTDNENNGSNYDFITEISPNIWKIYRKSDRMEYLAQDITDIFFANADEDDWELTDYGQLLGPDGEDLMEKVKIVLNHPNLVSLVDSFALQFSSSGKLNGKRWFTVWDYCDAGNLGNLFVPPQPHPKDRPSSPEPEREDGDTRMEDVPPASEKQEDPKFLPESFCWHVLTSVLRALTWLHDGVRDVVLEEHGWKRLNEDLDWSPMLHRDITPQNIFIGYPRRREWYGHVKLGNYGRLFISGHCQTAGDKHVPTFSKVIGPHPSQDVTPLEDLIRLDANWGSIYPYQPNQPYTMVSEYRALGEIIQAMMITPEGGEHVKRIQSQSARANLKNTKYSGRLKNFVVKLMEVDPWRKVAGANPHPNPTYVTSDLYREALEGVQWFMATGSDEAVAYVTSQMTEVEDYVEDTALRAKEWVDSFENVKEILEEFSNVPPS